MKPSDDELGKMQFAEAYLAVVLDLARDCDFELLEHEAGCGFRGVQAQPGLKLEGPLDLTNGRVRGHADARDNYTAGHCTRVAEYATRLAERTGITGRELTWMRMGALLHDVGKTAVDPAILNKPGKLDAAEWEQMKTHATMGDSLVSGMNFPGDIRPMVRNHHEHWDGSGYPDGLIGEAIPLTARILCVADVFDALTTTRSYRPAYSTVEALRIMSDEAGTVLDPRLFLSFAREVAPGIRHPVRGAA